MWIDEAFLMVCSADRPWPKSKWLLFYTYIYSTYNILLLLFYSNAYIITISGVYTHTQYALMTAATTQQGWESFNNVLNNDRPYNMLNIISGFHAYMIYILYTRVWFYEMLFEGCCNLVICYFHIKCRFRLFSITHRFSGRFFTHFCLIPTILISYQRGWTQKKSMEYKISSENQLNFLRASIFDTENMFRGKAFSWNMLWDQ